MNTYLLKIYWLMFALV